MRQIWGHSGPHPLKKGDCNWSNALWEAWYISPRPAFITTELHEVMHGVAGAWIIIGPLNLSLLFA